MIIVSSCAVNNVVSEDELYLSKANVTAQDKDERAIISEYFLKDYIIQSPNRKVFGMKIPLGLYLAGGKPTNKSWFAKMFHKIGETPVTYDESKALASAYNMQQALQNNGYMKANVSVQPVTKERSVAVNYNVHPGERYVIHSVSRVVEDSVLRHFICGEDTLQSLLSSGKPFSINIISDERNRITNLLRNNGYYKFTKDNIKFQADTAYHSNQVDLTMTITLHKENSQSVPTLHTQYRIGKMTFMTDVHNSSLENDTITRGNNTFIYSGKRYLRPSLLQSNSLLSSGNLYSEKDLRRTYTNYSRLSAISFSNLQFTERPNTDTLDVAVHINRAKPYSIGLDVEATNSAGDLGAAVAASLQHKNIFRGSEIIAFKLRGAYESITGLEGYEGRHYFEVGGELRLTFPTFLFPYVKRSWGIAHSATSEISLQYNLQDRPEFQRRVLTAAWRYRWQSNSHKRTHKFDLLEVNYVYMPRISQRFKEQYLDSIGKTNAILKYNYENILITKLGYTYTYNSLGGKEQTYGKNAHTIRFNIETSGNVLYGLTSAVHGKQNKNGQYTFCGIAFAQYVKGDFDFAKSIRIDQNNSIALHAGFGIAYPYGNTTVLPFEKRYFAGGANSVRGWSIRGLGPGTYNGTDRGINFINQSGDLKLDLNIEYRTHLFWKFNGAVFIDAGNIWTIRKYEDQPGGEFRFDKFWQQIAASYGLGIRLDLSYFVIRFDAGMKAVNPAYTGRDQFPIYHPNFSRDFAFHFAVGLPF